MKTLKNNILILIASFLLTSCLSSTTITLIEEAIENNKPDTPPITSPIEPEPNVPEENDDSLEYYPYYHHTATGSSDGGTSLVLCHNQDMMFSYCSVNNVTIDFHGVDGGRYCWWNMNKALKGDMICKGFDGKLYKFKVDKTIRYGTCQ